MDWVTREKESPLVRRTGILPKGMNPPRPSRGSARRLVFLIAKDSTCDGCRWYDREAACHSGDLAGPTSPDGPTSARRAGGPECDSHAGPPLNPCEAGHDDDRRG